MLNTIINFFMSPPQWHTDYVICTLVHYNNKPEI